MRRILVGLGALCAGVAAAVLALRLLYPLPDIDARAVSTAIPADAGTAWGRRMLAAMREHPGRSGVLALRNGHDALASRLELIETAERSIDAQYYIWHDDTSGILLLDALHRAAERGVRVRLLLDDNGVPGLDATLAALHAQPGFEIRLFNPSTVRRPKLLGYAFDFARMNRRMHNKALIVDGAVTVIGGRNIGDEYFQVGDGMFYVDMDVLAAGAVVPDAAQVFDAYWNSPSVHAVDTVVHGGGAGVEAFLARAEAVKSGDAAAALRSDMAASARAFAEARTPLEWTEVRLVADDPVKGEGLAERRHLMIFRLGEILGDIESRLLLVSAYFVPGEEGSAYFASLARKGLDVRILTNAMDTTDVLMVHAGYAKYREPLLDAGAKLYELKLRGDTGGEDRRQLHPFGLSGASLHAKTFAVDGERVFIGSFNFDPRSALLNCEMGLLIHSPALAQRIGAAFQGPVDDVAYRPALDAGGAIVWHERLPDGTERVHTSEPGAGWAERLALAIVGLLPVEWLL
jgi:putative cardiolipin synthase